MALLKLKIGDKVSTARWNKYQIIAKRLPDPSEVTDIRIQRIGCESGVMVKIDTYPSYVDSNWFMVD